MMPNIMLVMTNDAKAYSGTICQSPDTTVFRNSSVTNKDFRHVNSISLCIIPVVLEAKLWYKLVVSFGGLRHIFFIFAPCKVIRIPKPRKYLIVESEIQL